MGQNCCKPCGGAQWKRLAKIKAEAAAAADAASHPGNLPQPDPTVTQLLVENDATPPAAATAVSGIAVSASSAAPCGPPLPDGPSDVRIVIETEDDDALAPSQPDHPHVQSRLRTETREWLHRQRMLLARARRLGHRHSHKKHKKHRVALAHEEAPTSGMHPIVLIEASSDDSGASHGRLLLGEDRFTQSQELVSNSLTGRPQLLAPTPRRPAGPRFPFLNPGTVSIATTRSSNESHPSMAPSTAIALRQTTVAEDVVEDAVEDAVENVVQNGRGEQPASHRNSLRSSSPSIYYLAPTSPETPATNTMPADNRAASTTPAVPRPNDGPGQEQAQPGADGPFLSTVMSYMNLSWQRPWASSPA